MHPLPLSPFPRHTLQNTAPGKTDLVDKDDGGHEDLALLLAAAVRVVGEGALRQHKVARLPLARVVPQLGQPPGTQWARHCGRKGEGRRGLKETERKERRKENRDAFVCVEKKEGERERGEGRGREGIGVCAFACVCARVCASMYVTVGAKRKVAMTSEKKIKIRGLALPLSLSLSLTLATISQQPIHSKLHYFAMAMITWPL